VIKAPARLARLGGLLAAAFSCAFVASAFGLQALDRAWPPPLDLPPSYSREVLDRTGQPLRIYQNGEGRWRLKADLDRIDKDYLSMLIAWEDKRFHDHRGVDPLAVMRAAGQFLTHGRVVSGGSTITMQLARLLEPRQERSLGAKLRQMARAIQIERRLTKRQILERYLTLAPYGGNIEGLRAASLAWFGREPSALAPAEAALLVALPQSPEARRPDRFPKAARSARDRVADRMVDAGIIDAAEAAGIVRRPAPSRRLAMPVLAPHLADAAIDRNPDALEIGTTLDAAVQARLEAVVRDAAARIGQRVSVALVAADATTGEILARIGSPGHLEAARLGSIDMTTALRSPGSTLKPFIYGLAIEEGLVLPETTISDRPQDFGGYKPANFDMTYQGDVSIRQALQMSLNVPAISLLDRVGPTRLVARLRRAGVSPVLPEGERAGLSIGLGGVGITLVDLVQLYANLARAGGDPIAIGDGVHRRPGALGGLPMLSPVASWHVGDMLSGIPNPNGSRPLRIAWKTGTSYGYRDAWAVGYDGRHVIGVWVGRADNGSVPGITGANTAGPILFSAFDRAGFLPEPLPKAPAGALRIAQADLPPSLVRFTSADDELPAVPQAPAPALHIAFPVAGTELELPALSGGSPQPVVLKLQGGTPPFRLLANGRPAGVLSRTRQFHWLPDGMGFTRLTVIDAVGLAQSVEVELVSVN
jgi:penicillin-binding protein 1C